MEKNKSRLGFDDVISFDILGQKTINKMNGLNESIYGSKYGFTSECTKELLEEILNDLSVSVNEVENLIAEYYYEVDYYRKQSIVLNSAALKQQYILSSFKMGLLQSRLNYLRQLETSVKNVLDKKSGTQLIR